MIIVPVKLFPKALPQIPEYQFMIVSLKFSPKEEAKRYWPFKKSFSVTCVITDSTPDSD